MKRLAQAGLAIWFYQDGTSFEYGTFAANITGIVRAEMNAEFRRQIGKWTREAMVPKAQAGHVTGGQVFGYDNVRVNGHVERHINGPQAAVVRRIFALSAACTGYARLAKQLNAEQAPAPKPQQRRPAGRVESVDDLRNPAPTALPWRSGLEQNAEARRGGQDSADGAARSRVAARRPTGAAHFSDEVWEATHRRLDAARAQYDPVTHGQRRPERDRDSKYLLTGFGRCALCGGGLHVRSRSHGRRRAFFYACTSHYNRGPAVCAHVDQWPMEEIDREVLATIAGDVLTPELADEVIATARQMFEASARPHRQEQLRRELATVEREQARLTDAGATGAGAIPILVERLRTTDGKRLDLIKQLERTGPTSPAPSWREIERRIRGSLTDWRSLLIGNVAHARQGFRQLLTTPIRFTPCVERGFRAIRFEGRLGLDAVFGGMVTNVASPTGTAIMWRSALAGLIPRVA